MRRQPFELRTADLNPFLPESLRESEERLRRTRRGYDQGRLPPAVGVGLSGGGIRSATFCLGVFQALARKGLLRSIDYMSTVSGGGYFGSFLGRLFTRDYVEKLDDVNRALDGDVDKGASGTNPHPPDIKRGILPWLRENGRYLSPRGAGDLMTMLAGVVRNWMALHVTLLSVVLLGTFLTVLLRTLIEVKASGRYAWFTQAQCISEQWGLWLSPLWIVAAAVFAAVALPAGWAYWLLELPSPEPLLKRAGRTLGCVVLIFGLAAVMSLVFFQCPLYNALLSRAELSQVTFNLVVFVLSASFILGVFRVLTIVNDRRKSSGNPRLSPYAIPPAFGISVVVLMLGWLFKIGERAAASLGGLIVLLLLAIWAAACGLIDSSSFKDNAGDGGRKEEKKEDQLRTAAPSGTPGSLSNQAPFHRPIDRQQSAVFVDALARNRLTSWLRAALLAIAAILVVTALDSMGESLYRGSRLGGGSWNQNPLGALAFLIAALAAPAAKVLPSLMSQRKRLRSAAYLNIVLAVAAVIVAAGLLSGTFWLAHALRWEFRPAPRFAEIAPSAGSLTSNLVVGPQTVQLLVTTAKDPPAKPLQAVAAGPHVEWLVVAAAVSLLFALAFGATWSFLNSSSQLPFYKARLARAYLGASNRRRLDGVANAAKDVRDIARVVPDDDVDLLTYFGVPCMQEGAISKPDDKIFLRGAPLHLINVTINETTGDRSQVKQQDRKGLGFCLGPCGLSAGVDGHVVFDRGEIESSPKTPDIGEKGPWVRLVYPDDAGGRKSCFMVRTENSTSWMTMEPLTLGHWTAISGAAFSTGTGYRTSFGLSLLAGLGNVRLGYWWDSCRLARWSGSIPMRVMRRAFAVQAYLLQEFLARFPGTSRRHWYLSDGGHFENLGGYELIRRRLPLIILVDAEADPDFEFSGLAGLVRKVRIDFGAQVHFLESKDLARLGYELAPGTIGTLDQLKRGKWEPNPGPSAPADKASRTLTEIDPLRYSHVHAALAAVTYPDTKAWSVLVYVKASMTGDEPLDLRQYHREHKTFPHEPTSDQFFDEAQWESYRKLGEHVADEVFESPESDWSPERFELPFRNPWIDLVNTLRRHTSA